MRKSRKVLKWMIGILVVLAVAAVVALSLLQRTTPQYTGRDCKNAGYYYVLHLLGKSRARGRAGGRGSEPRHR